MKPTKLLCTPGLRGLLDATFHGRYCDCKKRHEEQAVGKDDHGQYNAHRAAWYPRLMNECLAKAAFGLADRCGGGFGAAHTPPALTPLDPPC